MAESVQVVVRCRPMNSREMQLKCKNVVMMDADRCTCSLVNPADSTAPAKSFTFDGVYDVHSTTEQIYNEIAYPLVEGVLEGYNSTVFAYGQTGCGKSFSMQGVSEPPSQRGIVPRAFDHVFESVALAEGVKFLVLASFLEIYNEEIRDLLGNDTKRRLDLKESPDRGVYVNELSQHAVSCVSDCQALMEAGWRARATGATLMNADSSRSHSIFSVAVEAAPAPLADGPVRRGKLSLVDLAGSERQAKTGASGDRLKEATKINLSLSALGNVISALVDGKAKHIPYRDSKLTRLLKDSLGGNTKTLMVACLSPADNNYDETLSTLRYANRAKNIRNEPHVNEDPKDAMLREYQLEILNLKAMLESTALPPTLSQPAIDEKLLEKEKEKVRLEFEKEMESLRDQYMAMQLSKSQVQSDLQDLQQQYERDLDRITSKSQNKNNLTATPAKTVEEVLQSDKSKLNSAQQEILKRLQNLQSSVVGGERAGDAELRERRQRKRRAAERRLQALADALARPADDDRTGLVLGVYDDIHDQMKNAARKHKTKVRALEREITDLQSEFENERTDYLETIRKQERKCKFYQQVLDQILPILKSDCNYSNLENIQSESIWSEDSKSWTIPELTTQPTRLPPATGMNWGMRQTAPGRLESEGFATEPATPPADVRPVADAWRKKLQKSEEDDFVGNYFKPKRATELLTRAKEGANRVGEKWKAEPNFVKPPVGGPAGGGGAPTLAPFLGQTYINSSWGSNQLNSAWTANQHIGRVSPDLTRRPLKLEALPVAKKKPSLKSNKPLNTLDVL